tara:strand:+ start:657 stop:1121 length:465 start_codon:yes stop_codon:yes gene_type:complete
MTKVYLVRFNVGVETYAKVCHWLPEGGDARTVGDMLLKFMVDLYQGQTKPRFTSPTILATRWVVWACQQQNKRRPLSVENIGVVSNERYVFADYVFDINCDHLGPLTNLPDIRCTRVNHNGGENKPVKLQPFIMYRQLMMEEKTEPIIVEDSML